MRTSLWFVIIASILLIASVVTNSAYFGILSVVSAGAALITQNSEIQRRRDQRR